MEVAARGDWRRGRRCGYGGANLGFGSTEEPPYTVGTNRHKDRQSGRGNTRIFSTRKEKQHALTGRDRSKGEILWSNHRSINSGSLELLEEFFLVIVVFLASSIVFRSFQHIELNSIPSF
jgi:hypothetical protein